MLVLVLLVGIDIAFVNQIYAQHDISNKNNNFTDIKFKTNLIHPRKPTAWETRKLFMTHSVNIPKILGCQKELEALSQEAINEEMLISVQNVLLASISQEPALFHWCFYYEMMIVDLKLEDINLNRSYTKKYSFFIEQMKKLWILARSLDVFFDTKKYFGYLRLRYIQINEDHFGKVIKPLVPPLGDEKKFFKKIQKKPAGLNFSDD